VSALTRCVSCACHLSLTHPSKTQSAIAGRWTYRNTILAYNWFSSVREKLDDPQFSSWFAKFQGFNSSLEYPGGTQNNSAGMRTNGTFHVPSCDWFGTATKPAKCSGFYHDQVRRLTD
jgi:hypothetical protein